MNHILVSVNPQNACDTPKQYLGSICEVVDTNKRLDLTTVSVWNPKNQSMQLIEVDSDCVEVLK